MATTITLHLTITDEDLSSGWGGDPREFALSAMAALHEVIGDDGGAYVPTVHAEGINR